MPEQADPRTGPSQPSSRRLISIHDVMPETLGQVRSLIAYLAARGLPPATLLVVPGKPWRKEELRQLRAWQEAGHELAGHGWVHRAEGWGSLYHRLHGLVLSRHVAEHLALSADEIADLVGRCHAWFGQQDLRPPSLYVPPAWAMGGISRQRLRTLPFRDYEVLCGVYHAEQNAFERMPVLGFEADTRWRAAALRFTNCVNRGVERWSTPARIALHPHDLELRMREDIDRFFLD